MLVNKLKYILFLVLLYSGTVQAQFYFFGRNKVQYDDFNWKVLKTEHFDIYFYDDFEEMAEIGSAFAEEAFSDLKVKFNNVVTGRIPLIFYNTHIHFQQTNTTPGFIPEGVGGFFEFLKGRVVIPYLGSIDAFRHVIRHELVHVFMTNKLFRVLNDHRVTTERYPPLWFTEGLAEFWSTSWDTQGEMVMRDAVINNQFVGLKDIYMIFGTFQMYKEGQNLLEFISRTYGKEKIQLLLENFWQFENFNDLMEFTIGKSVEEIDEAWTYYLKQKYFPLLGNKIPPENGSKKLTDFGFNFSPSFYMKDGTPYLYFVANRDGYSSIYEMPLKPFEKEKDKPEPEILVRGEKEDVFEAFHLLDASLNVSSKGIIAFITKSGATDALHFYSIKDASIIKTFQNNELISLTAPRWSASGSEVVFQAIDRKGYSDIFIYNFDSGQLTRITNDYYADINPVFGGGDSSIVFSSDRTDGIFKKKYNLFEYNRSNHSIDYITYCGADNKNPVFSPDFRDLYFISDYDGTQNIWRLERRGKSATGMSQITHFLTSVYDYTFIDKDEVVASAFEKFSFQLYKIKIQDPADSLRKFVSFDFSLTDGRWVANKIKAESIKEKLKYENKYTLDYAQSQVTTDPVYGTQGGALFSLSDLLSNDNYYFLIYNTAEIQSDILKSFNVAISRVNVGTRANFAYGLFHFSGRRYDIQDSDEYYYERNFGGYFTLFYPLSKFNRIEASVSLANSDKQVIENVIQRKALLVSNSISYVMDNSLWGPTGPLDGTRFRLLLGFTNDVKYSNVNYYTFIADFRNYYRLGFKSALAFRTALFYNEGREARRYIMGGSWDLRGWPRWSIRGQKMWISSVELRFPLIDLFAVRFPFVDFYFPNIRGALFFDAGNAWDNKYESTLGSVGGGIRINLFDIITLRYDIGKKIENNFNSFQNKLFYQFFIGWDF
ncbi:MAG: BamA/TamA family outer membrane protein [Ignavibacteriales bacterium]